MTPGEGIALFRVFLIFLEFPQPVSGQSQDGGHDSSQLGVVYSETLVVSLLKQVVVYLKMIFSKNHEQITRHLQFIFVTFPAESAETYDFQKRWMEIFSQKTNCLFVHIRWSIILEKISPQVFQHVCGRSFTKKTISDTPKMKNGFFIQRKKKLPSETLSVLPRCMLVWNMDPFKQTMPCIWP